LGYRSIGRSLLDTGSAAALLLPMMIMMVAMATN
jgi:hypothetical protein